MQCTLNQYPPPHLDDWVTPSYCLTGDGRCLRADIDLRKVNIRISGLIGQGRCGRVLLGMREDNGEMLAVKEVSLQEMGVEPQQLVQNLICEIQATQGLRVAWPVTISWHGSHSR